MAKFHPNKSRRGPLPLRYVVLLTLVFFIFSTIGGIIIANKGLKPTLMKYAESQNNRIAGSAVSYAIKKMKDRDPTDLIQTVQNQNGNISSISFYPGAGNKIAAQLQQDIQSYLDGAEEGNLDTLSDVKVNHETGELTYSVPLGQATNNALLGNLGPDIPIKFHVVGDVNVDTKLDISETGINGSKVMISIDVEVNVQTIIPFATKAKKYTQKILLPGGVYNMDVPEYYNGDGNASPPSIQLDGNKEDKATEDDGKNDKK